MATKTKSQDPEQETAAKPEPVDPGPLSFSDAQDVITSRGGAGASDRTSVFDDVIKASYETETTKEFTVPTDAADGQIKALRSAGNRLNVGLKVRHRANDNGTTTIQFLARDKRWRKTADETAQDDAPAGDTGAPSDGA